MRKEIFNGFSGRLSEGGGYQNSIVAADDQSSSERERFIPPYLNF
jgi:hypothetical protein